LYSRSLADFVLGFNAEGGDEISLEKWALGPAYINTARDPLIPQEICCRGREPPGVRF
jgi:hypothetical protein